MKQYTNESQTAKLIELGFEKPKNIVEGKLYSDIYFAYSIGELIEMLGYDLYSIQYTGISWEVKSEQVTAINEELIDALYDMIITLNEKGVI